MKKLFLLILLFLLMISCGSSKSNISKANVINDGQVTSKPKSSSKRKAHESLSISTNVEVNNLDENFNSNKRVSIVDYAKTFEGTKYKFGGTTKAGMDCSGLVYTAFQKEDVVLPRISRDMATKGVLIPLDEISQGDLVFFRTSKKNVISHVGLVVDIQRGEILFIHSTTRLGVIISSMEENYWKEAFVEVRRII